MPRLSLRAKQFASFVVILLPILGLLIYGYREADDRQVETILDDQMQTAQAVSAVVDGSFDEALTLGWALANDPVVLTLDPSQLDPYLEQLILYYPQYEQIGVVNALGDQVGTARPFPAGTQRAGLAADIPTVQQVLSTGQPVLGTVSISRLTLSPATGMGVPIRDKRGQTVGAVFVSYRLETLSRELGGVILGPQQSILLVDTVGTALFHTALSELPWEERNLSGFEPVKAALEGRPTEVRRFVSPVTGDTRMGAFTPTPKYGWVVGVTIREDVALAPVRAALRDQLLGFGAIVVLSMGLVFIFSYALLKQVRQLSDQALALGRGDLTRRVAIKTGDEIKGRTFTSPFPCRVSVPVLMCRQNGGSRMSRGTPLITDEHAS
ncbi:MAG: HAMP domain-containing protein [Chloroflexota bacterium]|nr:MAG: HAMP domain-containing protein [Chloroflexota bacterium]